MPLGLVRLVGPYLHGFDVDLDTLVFGNEIILPKDYGTAVLLPLNLGTVVTWQLPSIFGNQV